MKAVLEIFFSVQCSIFVRQKVTFNKSINFADSVSEIRLPDVSKLAKTPKNDNDVTIFCFDVDTILMLFCFSCEV